MGPTATKTQRNAQTNGDVTHESQEKDETEQRLEKLLFGDEAGFLESLHAPSKTRQLIRRRDSAGSQSNVEEDADLDGVADEDVRSCAST